LGFSVDAKKRFLGVLCQLDIKGSTFLPFFLHFCEKKCALNKQKRNFEPTNEPLLLDYAL
jgi:hypothetical protein